MICVYINVFLSFRYTAVTMFAKLAGTWLKGQLLMNQDTLATEEFVSAVDVLLRHKSIMNFVLTQVAN